MSKSQASSPQFVKCLSGFCIGAACLSVACGPNLEADRVMTPEERLLEQEQLAYEAEQENAKRGDRIEDFEEDEAEVFDEKGAEMELKRASLSGVTCPDVVGGKHPKAVAEVTIVFGSDGKVRNATVAPPFEGELAECILNAYRSVILKPFREKEYTMAWKLDLTGKKKDPKAAAKKK